MIINIFYDIFFQLEFSRIWDYAFVIPREVATCRGAHLSFWKAVPYMFGDSRGAHSWSYHAELGEEQLIIREKEKNVYLQIDLLNTLNLIAMCLCLFVS